MFYEDHQVILQQAAELLAGNEWANLDSNFANRTSDQVNIRPDGIFRAVVTTQCPAATKQTGPPVEWTAGLGGEATMYQLVGRGTATPYEDIFIDGSNGQTQHLEPAPSVDPDYGDTTISVVNFRESNAEVDEEILLFLVGERYCIFPLGDSVSTAPKRVKFKLTESLLREGSLASGYAGAEVIDPMNSGLLVGDTLTVWDYKKQFVTSTEDAIGIAIQGSPFGGSVEWHIEEVEQLVNHVSGVLAVSLTPWQSQIIQVGSIKALSTWPYVHWDDAEDPSSVFSNIKNPRNIVAHERPTGEPIGPDVWLKRVIPDTHLPDPDNQIAPYTLNPIAVEWEIVSAKWLTAKFCETIFNSTGNFVLKTGANHSNGYDVAGHSSFNDGDQANPPKPIWDELVAGLVHCAIPLNTAGWARLDWRTGKYVTIQTASSLFGTPTLGDAVAALEPAAGDLLVEPKDSECGVFQHKHLKNTLFFGNQAETSGCKMEELTPEPTVDVLENAEYETVVTGTYFNPATKKLELTTKRLKACSETSGNITVPHSSTQLVEDVYCDGDGVLHKTYKTINYIGGETTGSNDVTLTCTNPNEYDWKYIFENHIYDETWWNVSYYDITWPDGCYPCDDPEPTGCCSYEDENGNPASGMVTESDCELLEGSYAGDGVECSGGGDCTGSDCCCGSFSAVTIQLSCPPGAGGPGPGPGPGGGDVSWNFVSLGTADGDGSCNWSVEGQWEIEDDMGSTRFEMGTVTLTHDGGGEFSGSGSVGGNSFSLSSNPSSADWDGGSPCSNSGQWTYTMDAETECENE